MIIAANVLYASLFISYYKKIISKAPEFYKIHTQFCYILPNINVEPNVFAMNAWDEFYHDMGIKGMLGTLNIFNTDLPNHEFLSKMCLYCNRILKECS